MLTLSLDPSRKEPLYQQLYTRLRDAIEDRQLSGGERLPSSRMLASHLGISRNTVDAAYGQLLDEGYIRSEPKRGCFVNDLSQILSGLETDILYQDKPDIMPVVCDAEKTPFLYDFSPYGVDLDHFPFATWRKLSKEILYDERSVRLFESGDPQGEHGFRSAIADYLRESRGVLCDPGQIIVGAGTDSLILLLIQLLDHDAVYAVENPSYLQPWRILSSNRRHVCPIPLDEAGMSVNALNASDASIAYITPSHHFPLGTVMPILRRQELLAWANARPRRYIIEDDYDSEFRYRGRPIQSLASIDTHGRVIYMGTFSKAIAPSIRIGYMVLPPDLIRTYLKTLTFYSNTVPRTDQALLTKFIRERFFERHLNRMRNVYKTKRDILLDALTSCGGHIRISGENNGLHLLLTSTDGRTETDLLNAADAAGIRLYGVSRYLCAPQQTPPAVLAGYGSIPETLLEEGSRRLADVLCGS